MSRSRSRTLVTVGGVAVAALAAGIFAGTRVTSPADAAARVAPPEASDVTVPVELRTLSSEVVTRGDVSFAGAVAVEPEVGGLENPPIVTGQVPEVGAEITEGAAILEIVGRPLIALAGELPMYRSLRPGLSGPDVVQLEQTLQRIGLDPGEVDDEYTAATGRAVAELFERIGYEPPPADPQVEAERDAAQDAVDAAEDAVDAAEQAREAAQQGPTDSERVAAENAVRQAERDLENAERAGDKAVIAQAKDQLRLMRAQLDDLLDGRDTSAEEAAVDAAEEQLDDARNALAEAEARAGTPLPASEVVYVPSLPRRVDEVTVRRGTQIDGAVMSVSGASLVITTNVDDVARALLAEDMPVTIELPTDEEVAGTITAIAAAEGEEATGYTVSITPGELTPEQVEALRGANVRITVPVESTDGDVLAVPLAALTAGPGGESRVEVQRDGVTELVEVEVGLTAEGYAEVRPVEGATLAEGDLVVVGEADSGNEDGEGNATDAETESG